MSIALSIYIKSPTNWLTRVEGKSDGAPKETRTDLSYSLLLNANFNAISTLHHILVSCSRVNKSLFLFLSNITSEF